MLRTLSIRNVLLIDRLDLNFVSGLSVLTGETGSGKSILLDALSLALGARANTELISQGADQSTIVAEFETSNKQVINNALSDYGIYVEKVFSLRRVISIDGRSRAFVGDAMLHRGAPGAGKTSPLAQAKVAYGVFHQQVGEA